MVWYNKKGFTKTLAVLALVGGAAHLLDATGIVDVLGWFGGFSGWVQGIAGAAGVWVAIKAFK